MNPGEIVTCSVPNGQGQKTCHGKKEEGENFYRFGKCHAKTCLIHYEISEDTGECVPCKSGMRRPVGISDTENNEESQQCLPCARIPRNCQFLSSAEKKGWDGKGEGVGGESPCEYICDEMRGKREFVCRFMVVFDIHTFFFFFLFLFFFLSF